MTITCFAAWAFALLLLPCIVFAWATESRHTKIRRWRAQGWSQQRIANRLGVSRYAIRKALSA